ncbi:unnamed protein product [Caenorhabditis brenneri]
MDPDRNNLNTHDDEFENQNVRGNQYPMSSNAKVDQKVLAISQKPLSQEIEDMLNIKRDHIDTKELSKTILAELSSLKIPQEVFAARLVNRTQGTLSDLLTRPKPWNVLNAGRKTYIRMYNWMMLPKKTKLAILYEEPVGKIKSILKRKNTSAEVEPTSKKPRLVFTEIQKNALNEIFKETSNPTREMKEFIASHLKLDISTVDNFFTNTRRRSRCAKAAEEQNSTD